MKHEVKKLWYTIDALNYPFDITTTQPQLFVTATFENLIDVLEEFADTMAFRKGGAEGVLKAIECKNVCTVVYSSGLQVSGIFTAVKPDDENNVTFIKTAGPAALAFENNQLSGHDKNYHKDGFSSPVGKLKGQNVPLENLSKDELQNIGIAKGKETALEFQSGTTVSGTVAELTFNNEKLLIITFTNCTVKGDDGKIYFEPTWGNYDMAVGEKIISVSCGAADKNAYEEVALIPKTQTHYHDYTVREKEYQQLFQAVRNCRQQHDNYIQLLEVWNRLKSFFPDDWLCSLEILEIMSLENIYTAIAKEIKDYLESKVSANREYRKLISDGFYLIDHPVIELATN